MGEEDYIYQPEHIYDGLNKDSIDHYSINVYELTRWDDSHQQLDKLR